MPSTEQLARKGVDREKLIAWDVPHPFDPASRKPKEHAARQRYEAFYAGSINKAKGIREDLIHAVALLRGRGITLHCSLAGGGDIVEMKALCASLGVSDQFTFLGLIDNRDVINRMAGADVVVVPSRTEFPEGFPLTLFEAIGSRTPIICTIIRCSGTS